MDSLPRPPIVIYDNGDLEVFPDVGSACDAIEVYDVGGATGVAAFDSLGTRLQIQTSGYDIISMTRAEGGQPAPDELAQKLRDFIESVEERVGPGRIPISDAGSASLEALLDALLGLFQASPKDRRRSVWRDRLRGLYRGRG